MQLLILFLIKLKLIINNPLSPNLVDHTTQKVYDVFKALGVYEELFKEISFIDHQGTRSYKGYLFYKMPSQSYYDNYEPDMGGKEFDISQEGKESLKRGYDIKDGISQNIK